MDVTDYPSTQIPLSGSAFPSTFRIIVHFHFSSSLILLFSYAQLIARLSIPFHLSFPLLYFMLDIPDPLIEQRTTSSMKAVDT